MHPFSLPSVVSLPAIRLLRAVPLAAGLALAGAVIPAGAAAALPSNCSQSGSTVTCTFNETGAAQSWTVPVGVTAAIFHAYGAHGAAGGGDGAQGGSGGEATATIAVNPGDTIEIVVGGSGGFNGGGTGGTSDLVYSGGSGGGASDIRTGACAATLSCGLSDRVLIGAGGGGGGGQGHGGAGGAGGVTGGGGGGGIGAVDAGGASTGATASTFGTGGGSPSDCGPAVGANGSAGAGGSGGSSDNGGGGGGGGLFGGGGGGGGCFGGGGGGGGGGSSFGPGDATFTSATNTGNGQVTVSYTVPPLMVTTTSLPAATGGQPYSATLAATGGEPPYSWSVTSGSLPPGLHLDAATGVISGTPDVAGTYGFTVTVTDSESPAMTASKALSISVSGPVVTALSPDHGPEFGDTGVRITGTGLACPPGSRSCRVSVSFGGDPALVVFVTPTQIEAVAPGGTGTVTVTVTVGGVSSQATAATMFTYEPTFSPFRFLP